MAITINGSTGIVEANIADNAITTNKIAASNITAAKLASASVTAAKIGYAGAILQVGGVSDQNAYVWSASGDYVNAGNLTINITPLSATSKILVMVSMNLCHPDSDTGHVRMLRNSTQIACGLADIGNWPATTFSSRIYSYNNDSGNYNVFAYSMQYIDSPATTSTLTYKMQVWPRSGQPMSMNRSLYSTTSDPNMGRQISTLTVMEIAQ